MPNDFDAEALRKRLDTIILLLLESSAGGAETISRKVEKLLELGLSNAEVAQIIGKKLNYVTAIVAKKAKAQKKGSTQ